MTMTMMTGGWQIVHASVMILAESEPGAVRRRQRPVQRLRQRERGPRTSAGDQRALSAASGVYFSKWLISEW